MQKSQPSLFARDDTFFGVCEGLGEDFGFNPLYLRLAVTLLLFWNPVVTISGYVITGLVLAGARWLYPVRPAGALQTQEAAPAAQPRGQNDGGFAPTAAAA